MPKTKQVDIALLGCGKLGQGVYKLWKNSREKILDQSGIKLNIKHILVKHIQYKRDNSIDKEKITNNVDTILNDGTVKIVIDTIGGIEPTYGIVKNFLDRGLHLVSANRALLASKLREIFELARSKKVHLKFDAALGGGIPIIRTLRRDLIAARIERMLGIVSGSSNFILSEMTRNKRSLKEILKLPGLQKLSESHLLADYEGSDAAQKITLLAATAFGVEVNYLHVHAEGIENLEKMDIEFAEEFGYHIKLLAIIKNRNDGLELRVHPTFVPINHPLNSVEDEYNAYYIETDNIGKFMLYGKGAGINPAANMVIRDLVEIAITIKTLSRYMFDLPLWDQKPVLPIEEIESGYYLRFLCLDMPGVMGKIATVLGNFDINIGSAHASAEIYDKKEKKSFVHIFTEMAKEKDIQASVEEIKKLNVIQGDIKYFRILGEQSDVNSDFRI